MELHNSGVSSLEVHSNDQGWIRFEDAYLREGMEYRLRFVGEEVNVSMQSIPIPFYKQSGVFYSAYAMPFQSGVLRVTVNAEIFEVFVYPDDRKFTEEQFNQMVDDILTEANSCFQYSGLTMDVAVSGRTRQVDWIQWSYIERTFNKLQKTYLAIEKQPLLRLEQHSFMMRRDKVQQVKQTTLSWLDKKGYGNDIPPIVKDELMNETKNVYENQVVKQQLLDLHRLLKTYETVSYEKIVLQARKYKRVINRWLSGPFLSAIKENIGAYSITQKFRKHPNYRLWYKWFDQLYKHKTDGIGFGYPIALKDTFELYEMWCYMKVVNIARKAGLVKDTSSLLYKTKDGIFLDLAERKDSRIQLTGNVSLYYQKIYQINTSRFYTYTQRMIPDIVLEGQTKMVVFDPKYRVLHNLSTALGEMHKYRDGIIERKSGNRAVLEVHILTPTSDEQQEGVRYFDEGYQERYQMGAFKLVPGEDNTAFSRKIVECVESISTDISKFS